MCCIAPLKENQVTMKLYATDITATDGINQLLSFALWDEKQFYGIGFIKDELDKNRIELMVSDQSVYDLKDASILFTAEYFELKLKDGTIRATDGEDIYQIYYERLTNQKYSEMKSVLTKLMELREDIKVEYSK